MIEVLHYETANRNSVIGYVDIKLPKWNNMIIRRIAHVQSKGRRWFNLPNFSREKPDGTKEYLRYWQFEQEAYNAQFLEMMTEKVKEYCMANKIAMVSDLDFSSPPITEELPF